MPRACGLVSLLLLGACAEEPWRPTGRPAIAEGVVLLAQLSPTSLTVSGALDGVPQRVDLDGPFEQPVDERYGFRYRVRDADGQVLAERSTTGPALVEAFLEYWSEVSGVDLLEGVPTLGRFPVVVPLLEGASSVSFEMRSAETGEYEPRGSWSYDELELSRITPDPTLAVEPHWLTDPGPGDHKLDIVILPDGYRKQDLDQFAADAEEAKKKLLSTEPFATYADRINLLRLDIPSEEAGASYDCPTCGVVDNAFGSIFALEVVNRALGTNYDTRAIFQADQWRVAEALAPYEWDAVLVLVNSQKFGGMAVHYAVVTRGVERGGGRELGRVAVHELGHAFGMLGDEYVSDACIRSERIGLPENITDRPKDPPWTHLLEPGVPLPTPPGQDFRVGAYEGAWNCPDLYRPEEQCLMNSRGPFCEVCSELLVRRLLRFGDPAEAVTVEGSTLRIDNPLPDTTVTLTLDGKVVGTGPADDPPRVPRRGHVLEVKLVHSSPFVTSDPEGDLEETWRFSR